MRKNVLSITIIAVFIMLLFISCNQDNGNGSTVNTTGLSADDIVAVPDGFIYRANAHLQGIGDTWAPIETVELTFGDYPSFVYIQYRAYIETSIGETRNNIINVRIPDSIEVNTVELEFSDVPSGITAQRTSRYSAPGISSLLVEIEISPDVKPGQYTLNIGIIINGNAYATVPCSINVKA